MTAKTLVPFFSIFLLCNLVSAQDLIVTKSNDSISCKITKVKKDNIYFVFKNNEEYQSTLMALSKVESYIYNFEKGNEVPIQAIPGYEEFSKLRITFNGGYSYQTGKISGEVSSELREYVRELRNGYHLGGDLTYFFSEFFGIGAQYKLFRAETDFTNVVFFEAINNGPVNRVLRDDITISFIAAMFSTRFYNKKKNSAFFLNSSIGYMNYKNETVVDIPFQLKGNTIGFASDIGYDISVSNNLSIGLQASVLFGRLKEVERNDGNSSTTLSINQDEGGGLGRLDFSVGLRYNL